MGWNETWARAPADRVSEAAAVVRMRASMSWLLLARARAFVRGRSENRPPRRSAPGSPMEHGGLVRAACGGHTSAVATAEDAEEGFDVLVGAGVAVLVEVGGAGAGGEGAVAAQAG